MDLRLISEKEKIQYNRIVTHIVQSWQWGEFRKKLGIKLIRYGFFENNKLKTAFHLSFHKIPFSKYFVGYLPKGPFPDSDLKKALEQIGKEQNCALIKVEPNIESRIKNPAEGEARQGRQELRVDEKFKKSEKPHFAKYSYILDLTKSEEEILKKMHPKFRYNIKVAEKHGVFVEERTDEEAFKIYLKLFFETCERQHYFGHDENYHRQIWQILKQGGLARILIAFYHKIPLNAWMIFNFHDTSYYPYGGSSPDYKNMMAANLTCWEAIKLGKKMKLKNFDLWGAAAPEAEDDDQYWGFTRFKAGTGARLVEYLDTYDLILNPFISSIFTFIDKMLPLKVLLLKLIKK